MRKFLVFGFSALGSAALAISPTSYDMPNGNGLAVGGSFNYWDLNYTGSGNTTLDNAPLTNGLGDLTDGFVSNQNWSVVENIAGTGPYVGWSELDPTVTFRFGSVSAINQITVYADDADGGGGVSLPDAVRINGTLFDVDQNMAGREPKALVFSGLGLNTDTVDVQFIRSNRWVFVSEVTFSAVPEPGTIAALGLGALMLLRRRRR